MTDNMKEFLEAASTNGKIQDSLIKANEDYFHLIIDTAKEYGFELTKEDISEMLKADKNHDGKISEEELASFKNEKSQKNEKSDDELNAVSGGVYEWNQYGHFASSCFCAIGGGGGSDQYQKTCACILAGAGELTDYGKQEAAAGHIYADGSEGAPVAMWCSIGGDGDSGWNPAN